MGKYFLKQKFYNFFYIKFAKKIYRCSTKSYIKFAKNREIYRCSTKSYIKFAKNRKMYRCSSNSYTKFAKNREMYRCSTRSHICKEHKNISLNLIFAKIRKI